MSGKCLKCIHHTTGFNCEHCSPGFWGDALAEVKGDCKFCSCYSPGTVRPSSDYDALECRQSDGQCNCQPNVIGKQCEMCQVPQLIKLNIFNFFNKGGLLQLNIRQRMRSVQLWSARISRSWLWWEIGTVPVQVRCYGDQVCGLSMLIFVSESFVWILLNRCDQCANRHYGFEKAGCKECICDSHGAEDSECDLKTGIFCVKMCLGTHIK
jgi:coxsackievirus/adenovirus receptor